eukprot:m.36509 g.36509  ORF g.36509 m.36509 type:complete len:125 (-) comp11276_c0_seq1:194-568(-)
MASIRSILVGYAAFLFFLGFAGFASSNFEAKAKSAIIVGSITSLLQIFAYFLYTSYNAHVGLLLGKVFMAVNAALFGWRAYLAWPHPEKRHIALLVAAMCVGSVFALFLLHRTSPSTTSVQKQK